MRYLAIVSAFAIGLACGSFGVVLTQHQANLTKVEPRAEAISILEDEVMSVVFRTDKMTFAAQRSMPGAAFAVQVTYADGGAIQQCQASPNLAGQLAAYSTITVKHQLQSQQQAEMDFPVQLGTLELRDHMDNEPTLVMRLRASADRKALAALYDDVAVEVTNSESAFTTLEKGCQFLAGQVTP